jgi:hypothetical protein
MFQPDPTLGPIGAQIMHHLNTGGHDPLGTPFQPHPLGGPDGGQLQRAVGTIKPPIIEAFPPPLRQTCLQCKQSYDGLVHWCSPKATRLW